MKQRKAKRGAPRRYSEGSKRFNVTIDAKVIAAWRAAGGTDLPSDVAKAFSEKYRLQLLDLWAPVSICSQAGKCASNAVLTLNVLQ